MKGGEDEAKTGKPKSRSIRHSAIREAPEPAAKPATTKSKAPEAPPSRIQSVREWAGWPLFNHLPVAIAVTILVLFVVGLFVEAWIVYAFLAVSTYVLTDLALGLVVTRKRGRFKILKGWVKDSSAKAYYALLVFIVVLAPFIAAIIILGPTCVFGYTNGFHAWGRILSDLVFSAGTAILVYGYLELLGQ